MPDLELHLILLTADISPEVLSSERMCNKWLAVFAPYSSWPFKVQNVDFSHYFAFPAPFQN
jgi:hypothetical protein